MNIYSYIYDSKFYFHKIGHVPESVVRFGSLLSSYVITDNAKDLSGTKVQQSLNLLGIKKATISPNSHKSNYSELLIRYLTYSIRINTQEKCIPQSERHRILPLALLALNTTNYSRLNY